MGFFEGINSVINNALEQDVVRVGVAKGLELGYNADGFYYDPNQEEVPEHINAALAANEKSSLEAMKEVYDSNMKTVYIAGGAIAILGLFLALK
jgi:hypothetical protein